MCQQRQAAVPILARLLYQRIDATHQEEDRHVGTQDGQRVSRDAVAEAIDADIDINAELFGMTAWLTAKRTGFDEIVKLLESKGADTSATAPSVPAALDAFLGPQFNDETPSCAVLVARDGNVTEALEDVWWALLNSNEFILDH